MRIALVCQSYPPMISGISTAVRSLAEGLAARGHAVLVLTASDRGQAYQEVRCGVRLARLTSLPTPARRGQRWSWWPHDDIEENFDAFGPQVIHLHDPVLGGLVIPAYAHGHRLPLVLTAHALPWYVSAQVPDLPGLRPIVEAALWAYASELLEHCQAVVAPSRFTARLVDSHGGPGAVVISNGVDIDRFHPGPLPEAVRQDLVRRHGLDPVRPIILHVGRIDREKNVDDVVRASAIAMASVDSQLVVAGEGSRQEDVERLAIELGIGPRSRFVGFVAPDGDLPNLYRMASVFAIASELESEGLVVLEAAACGVPVVAVEATSMPELVKEPGCGYLVRPGDVRGMARRIRQLLRDPAAAAKLGQAGVEMARQRSLALTLERHEGLYQRLIGVPAG